MHFSDDLWILIKKYMKINKYYISYASKYKTINDELMLTKKEECDEIIQKLLYNKTNSYLKKYENIFNIFKIFLNNMSVYRYCDKNKLTENTDKFIKIVKNKCKEMIVRIPDIINNLEDEKPPWYKRKKKVLLEVKSTIKKILLNI
jgi:predicted transcriptional regulator